MKYRVEVEVKQVSGSQIFEIEADNEQEAKLAVCRGEGEIVEERLNVESLNWPTLNVIKASR